MLEEIESLIIQAIKRVVSKPELLAAELHALYTIYRDLKVISNGNPQSSETKQA